MKNTVMAVALAGLALAGCDAAYPVAVIGDNGTVFRGAATDTVLRGGSFQATNGSVVCTGRYNKHTDVSTVSFPVVCNNGMRGLGEARFQNHTSGAGTVTMTDGSVWQFIFGQGALGV
jgi:hypothetical protein